MLVYAATTTFKPTERHDDALLLDQLLDDEDLDWGDDAWLMGLLVVARQSSRALLLHDPDTGSVDNTMPRRRQGQTS